MSRIDFLNPDNDERLLFSKICDLCERAERGRMAFSRFLNLREAEIAKAAVSPYKVSHLFYGGFEGGEKAMLGLCSEDMDMEKEYFPMSRLTLEFPKTAEIYHKDVLGSLMALGIERNSVGDIFLYENKASFSILDTLEDLVKRELLTVGRYPVKIKDYDGNGVIIKNTEDRQAVISSMRLDCVIAAILNKSRSQATEIIKKRPVFINDKLTDKIEETVPLGAVITVRGFGKFKLADTFNKTSKDKIRIVISKYI